MILLLNLVIAYFDLSLMLQINISMVIFPNDWYLYWVLLKNMLPLTFAGLLSTPAPTAPIIGIAFMALFGIMAVVVGPDYDGFNDPNTTK